MTNRQRLLYFYGSFLSLSLAYFALSTEAREEETSSVIVVEHSASDRSRLSTTLASSNFNRAMSQAHRHIQAKDWESASRVLESALKINSKSVSAKELLEFVHKTRASIANASLVEQLQQLIHTEQWAKVSEVAKGRDLQHSSLQADVYRAQKLTEFEDDLDEYLKQPQRFSRKTLQSEIQRLNRVSATVDLGTRLSKKHLEFQNLHQQWITPIEIVILSDGNTNVSIRPGRELGRFKTQRIRVVPGDYEISGLRKGYREMRIPVSLKPGDPSREIIVVANEPF